MAGVAPRDGGSDDLLALREGAHQVPDPVRHLGKVHRLDQVGGRSCRLSRGPVGGLLHLKAEPGGGNEGQVIGVRQQLLRPVGQGGRTAEARVDEGVGEAQQLFEEAGPAFGRVRYDVRDDGKRKVVER